MQKAVQLTTFCVKSKEKYQCSLFYKNAIVYVICHVFMEYIKFDIVLDNHCYPYI